MAGFQDEQFKNPHVGEKSLYNDNPIEARRSYTPQNRWGVKVTKPNYTPEHGWGFSVGHNGATAAPQASPAVPRHGSESGPGILESWFNQRAMGTDPASEYAMRRGMDAIDSRMAAGGSYNSGARGQQLSDYAANVEAQRMGQLDALAGGASGEHLGRLGQMFGQGMGLAQGQAGLASAYDIGAAGNIAASNQAMNQMALNSAGQQQNARQGMINNLMNAYGLSQMGG